MDVQRRSPTLYQAEAWVSMNTGRAALHGSIYLICVGPFCHWASFWGKNGPQTHTFPTLPPQNLAESTVGSCKLEMDYRRKRQSSRVWYLSSRGAEENQTTPGSLLRGGQRLGGLGSGSTRDLRQTGPLTESSLNQVIPPTAPLFSPVKCGYYLFITGSYMRIKRNNRREGLQEHDGKSFEFNAMVLFFKKYYD